MKLNIGIAFALFWIMIFAMGGLWFVLNSVITPYNENISRIPESDAFPALDAFVNYIFGAMAIIIIVAIFLYYSIGDKGI